MSESKIAQWSKAVRMRDGKCLRCGSVEDLHAHHIKAKADYPELKLEVSNGETLCYRCHKEEHEKNRPQRIRSIGRPQRKTLEAKIAALELEVEDLQKKLKIARGLIGECERGVCQASIARHKKLPKLAT